MNKVVIVIGQSASGKTTFVKENYLVGGDPVVIEAPIKHTISDKTLLLGDYLANRRCVGTDTLSYSALPKIISLIEEKASSIELLVAEGDRINNRKFFEFIKSLNVPVDLYVFSCSLGESIKRRIETGSAGSETFVKTTISKAKNMREFGRKIGFNVIDKNTDPSVSKGWW